MVVRLLPKKLGEVCMILGGDKKNWEMYNKIYIHLPKLVGLLPNKSRQRPSYLGVVIIFLTSPKFFGRCKGNVGRCHIVHLKIGWLYKKVGRSLDNCVIPTKSFSP